MRNSENHQLTSGAVVREETEKLPNAATMEERLQRFNPATMSGVFPGTCTITFERVRLAAHGKPGALTRWARISWYEDPPACTIEMESARMTSTLVPLEEQGESPEHLSARLEASTRTRRESSIGWQPPGCWLAVTNLRYMHVLAPIDESHARRFGQWPVHMVE